MTKRREVCIYPPASWEMFVHQYFPQPRNRNVDLCLAAHHSNRSTTEAVNLLLLYVSWILVKNIQNGIFHYYLVIKPTLSEFLKRGLEKKGLFSNEDIFLDIRGLRLYKYIFYNVLIILNCLYKDIKNLSPLINDKVLAENSRPFTHFVYCNIVFLRRHFQVSKTRVVGSSQTTMVITAFAPAQATCWFVVDLGNLSLVALFKTRARNSSFLQ